MPDNTLDILSAVALYSVGTLTFERVVSRDPLFRLLCDGRPTDTGLTTAKGARDTVAYWRAKGWAEQ